MEKSFQLLILPPHQRCSVSDRFLCKARLCFSVFPWQPTGRHCTLPLHRMRISALKWPQQTRPYFAPSVIWKCSPWPGEKQKQKKFNLNLWHTLSSWTQNRWGCVRIFCYTKINHWRECPQKAFSILIKLVYTYQKLNIPKVLRDTLVVSWVLPGGETDSIQGATA